MRSPRLALTLLAATALALSSCGEDEPAASNSSQPDEDGVCASTDAADDLLAQICEEGTITVSTDAKYPPQSSLNRRTGEFEGFDIDVATEIANRLGVDIAWQEPSWDLITAGSWNGRWDMSVGSMTPTNDRQEVLHFTEPYYFTPAVVVVHADNTSVSDPSTDLDGAKIGVCSGCTYQQYLDKSLEIKGFTFDFVIDDAEVSGYDTDTSALQDLALGDGTRLDAVMTSSTTAKGYADSGNPVKTSATPSSTSRCPRVRQGAPSRTRWPWWRRSTAIVARCTRTARSARCRRSGTTAWTSPSSSERRPR
jgi:polar amino acid transport system substrate-binding protein